MAHPSTLLHLVPQNISTDDVLAHPDNRRFVSATSNGLLGLEIGFHVTSSPGRVIARLGRDTDLILRGRNISAVHVAFEMHPDTLVMLLSVRSKRTSSVTVTIYNQDEPVEAGEEKGIDGDCVLVYGEPYTIRIAAHVFKLEWTQPVSPNLLRNFVIGEYHKALQQQRNIRSRHLPTEGDSELHTWHNTRVQSIQNLQICEAAQQPRVKIGEGSFANVFRAMDVRSGHHFAVKVIKLNTFDDPEHARAAAHRELKTLQRLKHKNIIEFLGYAKWDTAEPEIFMPLRSGNLRSLANAEPKLQSDEHLCTNVLKQCLSALDYLDLQNICHRDVKPDNILCWDSDDHGTHVFQLADFGLANIQTLARTKCGTAYYAAPELHLESRFSQSPKVDVWSLFATLIDIHPKFQFPPKDAKTYTDVLKSIRAAALLAPFLAPMAQEDPSQRASAAQMLTHHFRGEGLSRPRAQVPALDIPGDILSPSTAAYQLPVEPKETKGLPLVQYPRLPRNQPPQATGVNAALETIAGDAARPTHPIQPSVAMSLFNTGPTEEAGPSRAQRRCN